MHTVIGGLLIFSYSTRTMFRYFVFAAVFILGPFVMMAQNEPLDLQPAPVGGLERLALVYLKTDFTPEQRSRLNDVHLELIFFVDSTGMALLEDVNGINDPDIIDSLKQRKEIPPFRPRYVNGQFRNGIFFMMLSFPSYDITDEQPLIQRYGAFPMDQVEEVEYSGQSLQMMMGGVVNSFAGNPSRYLSTGGGIKMDVLWGFDKWGVIVGAPHHPFYSRPWRDIGIDPRHDITKTDPKGISFLPMILVVVVLP